MLKPSTKYFCVHILINLFSHSVMSHSATPWTAAHQASFTISLSLLMLLSIESMMPSNHFILCPPLLLPPSIFPSIRVFSNESVFHIRLPKYWSFSFNISPSNEYSGLISFRMNWLDLLSVQGTLKSLLQHHSSKASILHWTLLISPITSTAGCSFCFGSISSLFLELFLHSSPLSQRCHPTISSSVVPFSSHLRSFPASGSFPMSQYFTSGGQSTGVSASASVLPMNIQD